MRYLAVGLVLGVAAGLYFAWAVDPVEYVDTAPRSLRADFRDDYLALIASAYSATGDLTRAKARLALFPNLDPIDHLASLAQQRMAAGLPPAEAEALADLSDSLGRAPRPAATSVPLPTPTRTPRPVRVATALPTVDVTAPFELIARERVCDASLGEPLIQVEVFDADGDPLRAAEVLVTWEGGEDNFFTGLKPEFGEAYGDFTMSEGIEYSVRLASATESEPGIAAFSCDPDDDSAEAYLGSWLLRFKQTP